MKHLQKYNEGIFSINKNKNREKGIDKWSEEIFKGLNDSGVKTIKSNLDDAFNSLIDTSPESERYQSEKKRLLKLSEDMSIDDIKDIISDLNDDIGDSSSIHFKNGHYYVNYDVENLKYLNTNPMISDEYTRLINKLNDIHNKTKELYGASLFMQLISDNKRLSLDITREI